MRVKGTYCTLSAKLLSAVQAPYARSSGYLLLVAGAIPNITSLPIQVTSLHTCLIPHRGLSFFSSAHRWQPTNKFSIFYRTPRNHVFLQPCPVQHPIPSRQAVHKPFPAAVAPRSATSRPVPSKKLLHALPERALPA